MDSKEIEVNGRTIAEGIYLENTIKEEEENDG